MLLEIALQPEGVNILRNQCVCVGGGGGKNWLQEEIMWTETVDTVPLFQYSRDESYIFSSPFGFGTKPKT